MARLTSGVRAGLVRTVAVVAGAALVLAGASVASAQQLPIRNKKPVRRAVIDLEKLAQDVRPGQVLPEDNFGDPGKPPVAPAVAAAGAAAPVAATESAPGAAKPAATVASAEPVVAATATNTTSAPASSADPMERPPPPAVNGEAVKVLVTASDSGLAGVPQVQWRPVGNEESPWQNISLGARAEERIEVRTGLEGSTALEVDGQVVVKVDRLSRVRIERRRREDASELSVELLRGKIEVRPTKFDVAGFAVEPIRIRTPDATLLRRVGVGVVYDAFKGTRETVLGPGI